MSGNPMTDLDGFVRNLDERVKSLEGRVSAIDDPCARPSAPGRTTTSGDLFRKREAVINAARSLRAGLHLSPAVLYPYLDHLLTALEDLDS